MEYLHETCVYLSMTRVLVLCLLVAGCAPMAESECRSSNWYALGERDAMGGLPPRIDQYAYQCSRFSVQPSESTYMEGWQVGYTEWNRRMAGSRGM